MKKPFFTAITMFTFLLPQFLSTKDYKIPIFILNQFICVDAIVGGIKGVLILDTGAQGIALNDKYFKGELQKDMVTISANEANLPTRLCNADISIGTMKWRNRRAFLLSLGYLERETKRKILGLVGTRLFLKYRLTIDFESMNLSLSKPLENKERDGLTTLFSSGATVLPFKMKGCMPWVNANINGVSYKMGLDTGAEENFFGKRNWSAIGNSLNNVKRGRFRTVANQVSQTSVARLHGMTLGKITCYPMKTLAINMGTINHHLAGSRLDGILGYEFLQQFYRITFDFKRKELLLWQYDRKRYMVLGGEEE